jgi:hypothetical protein
LVENADVPGIRKSKLRRNKMEAQKRYKKGHFIEVGLAAGIPAGIPMGLILGNIALGPLFGVIIGLTTGLLLEKLFNKNAVELTEKERLKRKKISRAGIITGLALFLTIAVLYLSVKLF